MARAKVWGANQKEAETSPDPSCIPSRPFYAQTLSLPSAQGQHRQAFAGSWALPESSHHLLQAWRREVFACISGSQTSTAFQSSGGWVGERELWRQMGGESLGGWGVPGRGGSLLLRQCKEAGAWGHGQYLEEVWGRLPCQPEGVVQSSGRAGV